MFRPCIDLHEGKVKQIVGGSLGEGPGGLRTNFVSDRPAAWYAELYRRDDLKGGHVIMLGGKNQPFTPSLSPSDGERVAAGRVRGNEEAALEALRAYPGGLQIGGGINLDNARRWLDAGASHVIVTSTRICANAPGRHASEKWRVVMNAFMRSTLSRRYSVKPQMDTDGHR